MLYDFKKQNAYPMLCMNGCAIENIKYNDSYMNFIFKEGFLKDGKTRTKTAMLSVEGTEDNVSVLVSEEISSDAYPSYRTRCIMLEELVRLVKCNGVVIREEYHSANRVLLRGEILRPAKLLSFNHHRQLFEIKFSAKNDLRLIYYFND